MNEHRLSLYVACEQFLERESYEQLFYDEAMKKKVVGRRASTLSLTHRKFSMLESNTQYVTMILLRFQRH